MQYDKAEIVKIWTQINGLPKVENNIPLLSSADYRRGTGLYCLKCKHIGLSVLCRVNGNWACLDCNNARPSTGSQTRAINAYRVLNDLFAYFGETVLSETLFDPVPVQGFVEFANLKDSPASYLLFMSFLKGVLAREVSALKIVPYLEKVAKELNSSSNGTSVKSVNRLGRPTASAGNGDGLKPAPKV